MTVRKACSYTLSEVNSPYRSLDESPTIVSDRQKLELSRIKSRDSKNPKEHQKYLEDKKQYKKTIKDKKNSFLRKALASKNPKTVNKLQKRIKHEPSEMNNYLAIFQRTLPTKKILKVTLQHL